MLTTCCSHQSNLKTKSLTCHLLSWSHTVKSPVWHPCSSDSNLYNGMKALCCLASTSFSSFILQHTQRLTCSPAHSFLLKWLHIGFPFVQNMLSTCFTVSLLMLFRPQLHRQHFSEMFLLTSLSRAPLLCLLGVAATMSPQHHLHTPNAACCRQLSLPDQWLCSVHWSSFSCKQPSSS